MVFHENNVVPVIGVLSVNTYLEIVSVLLATLWCSGTSPTSSDQSLEGGVVDPMESVKFAPPPSVLTSHIHVDLDAADSSMGSEGRK